MRILLIGGLFTLAGCSPIPGRIKVGNAEVRGVKDAGTPASLDTRQAGASIALAAGSKVTVTKSEAVPGTPATKDAPAVPAQPAKETTEIVPSAPTEWHSTESAVKANTGTVDTTIAQHRIDAEESRILLYAAIAAAIGGGIFFWLHYPTPAGMCWAGALILFLAWKLAGLPEWFWVLAVIAVCGAVGLYFGHERAEKKAEDAAAAK